ncbi:rifin [Plasmodium falciparum RAJ116]|uniref:Rifin n=1 Tax=Plasmodium falciparum RAJ116 TaxID=580058 RepID=A0A0L0D146_PLAFA|nr:rifin [Plasmodium falciparum RAJ116]
MKVHYINILLFSLLLNILEHNKWNHNSTIYHKSNIKPIKSHRSLCVCKLYTPNYDNDPEMKEVMENFDRQTSQRFEEYNERMKDERQKHKDQCEKDIEKIILKDKIEKELKENFGALQTDIQSDAIPTCVCEKSLPDIVEKSCLKCGNNMGGLVPGMGLIGGTAVYAAAVKAATKAGMDAANKGLVSVPGLELLLQEKFTELVTTTNFQCPNALMGLVQNVKNTYCVGDALKKKLFCTFNSSGDKNAIWYAGTVQEAAEEGIKEYGTTFLAETSPNAFLTNPYISSSIAIMIIVAIILVIYLILRYKRTKKMKKKLQYIKLLKE